MSFNAMPSLVTKSRTWPRFRGTFVVRGSKFGWITFLTPATNASCRWQRESNTGLLGESPASQPLIYGCSVNFCIKKTNGLFFWTILHTVTLVSAWSSALWGLLYCHVHYTSATPPNALKAIIQAKKLTLRSVQNTLSELLFNCFIFNTS